MSRSDDEPEQDAGAPPLDDGDSRPWDSDDTAAEHELQALGSADANKVLGAIGVTGLANAGGFADVMKTVDSVRLANAMGVTGVANSLNNATFVAATGMASVMKTVDTARLATGLAEVAGTFDSVRLAGIAAITDVTRAFDNVQLATSTGIADLAKFTGITDVIKSFDSVRLADFADVTKMVDFQLADVARGISQTLQEMQFAHVNLGSALRGAARDFVVASESGDVAVPGERELPDLAAISVDRAVKFIAAVLLLEFSIVLYVGAPGAFRTLDDIFGLPANIIGWLAFAFFVVRKSR
jgi:hypothetical protein